MLITQAAATNTAVKTSLFHDSLLAEIVVAVERRIGKGSTARKVLGGDDRIEAGLDESSAGSYEITEDTENAPCRCNCIGVIGMCCFLNQRTVCSKSFNGERFTPHAGIIRYPDAGKTLIINTVLCHRFRDDKVSLFLRIILCITHHRLEHRECLPDKFAVLMKILIRIIRHISEEVF